MNNTQRKQIKEAIKYLQEVYDKVEFGFSDNVFLEDVLTEEQEKLDNIPDNLAQSERAEKFQENIDGLESAINEIEEAGEYLSQAMSALENAINTLNDLV